MEKITSKEQIFNVYFANDLFKAQTSLGIEWGGLNDENFWMVREQCRINDGTYTPIHIDGDDKMRFLHVSIDDPAKVSYTKDADKGRQDLQTRTTLAAYCEKFGLDISTALTLVPTGVDDSTNKSVLAAAEKANTVLGVKLAFKDYLGVDDSMPMADKAEVYVRTPAPNSPTTIREKLEMIQDLIDEVIADIG